MKYDKYILTGFIIWFIGLIILYMELGSLFAIAVWLVSFGNNIMLKSLFI